MSGHITPDVIRAGGRWPVALVASLALGGVLSCAAAQAAGPAGPAKSPAPGVPATLAPGTIETVAGGVGGPGPARRVFIGDPCALSFAAGYLYVAQGGLVRRIGMRTGWLTTPVGAEHVSGPGPNGGLASGASFSWSCGLATDHPGNLLIGDGAYWSDGSPTPGDNLVRVVATRSGTFYGQVMKARHVYTIGGDGTAGYSGDGGPALQAMLSAPAGITADPAGNLVFADAGNDRVRVIAVKTGTFYGRAMTAGDIYTVAGGGSQVPGDGGPATAAGLTITPQGDGKIDLSEPWPVVAVDHAGNIVLADTYACRVRVVAGGTARFYGQSMTAGDIYSIAGSAWPNGSARCGHHGSGGPARQARIGVLPGVALDAAGNVVVSDNASERIWVIAARSGRFYGLHMTAGDIYSVAGNGSIGAAGDGGPAGKAEFVGPSGVTIDSAGNILVADGLGYGDQQAYYENDRVQAIAARTGRFYGVAMTAGHVYTIAGTTRLYTGNAGPATRAQLAAGLYANGMALDRAGNMVFGAGAANLVLVVATRTGRFYGQAMRAGHIYAVAGGGRLAPGGGHEARQVRLDDPADVAIDHAGNLLIAGYLGNQVSVLAVRSGRYYGRAMTAGRVYVLAGTGGFGSTGNGGPATKANVAPSALAVDPRGDVIVSDNPDSVVRLIAARTGRFLGRAMTAGDIYTIAGDGCCGDSGSSGVLATSTGVLPMGVTADAASNVVIADLQSARIRVVAATSGTFYGQAMKAGHIYTIAGDGQRTYSGDGGPAVLAGVVPWSVNVDVAGNVLLAGLDGRVRVVAMRTGRFYGQDMTAGHIYTVAGGGTQGLGDGGPAVMAVLAGPIGVAATKSGALYINDTSRIRVVAGG